MSEERKQHIALYFAYGSNLNEEQMRRRCPTARLVGVARLHDHALTFGGNSVAWGGGVATIRPQIHSIVLGALFMMKYEDLEALDRFEGHPGAYERITRKVVDQMGVRWTAYTYRLVRKLEAKRPPSDRYFSTIEKAYTRLGLDVGELTNSAIDALEEEEEEAT